MRVELDPTFQGEAGMLHVWNATSGVIQITVEGHLLNPQTSAWVTSNSAILELIELGQAVDLKTQSGSGGASKKNGKKAKSVEEHQPTSETESHPAVLGEQKLDESVLSESKHDDLFTNDADTE